jgi:hypothetical protein
MNRHDLARRVSATETRGYALALSPAKKRPSLRRDGEVLASSSASALYFLETQVFMDFPVLTQFLCPPLLRPVPPPLLSSPPAAAQDEVSMLNFEHSTDRPGQFKVGLYKLNPVDP